MGFKACCILFSEREPLHFETMPKHDPERALRLISDLRLGQHRSRGMTTLDVGIYPDNLVVGAYDRAGIVGRPDIGNACLTPGADPITARIMAVYPRAAVLRVGLHSVVNLWSYAYFEDGKLVRAFGGSADDGVVLDQGELLAEERPHFERSVVRDGQRYFQVEINREMEEFDTSAFGEDLTFEVMARFLGCRFDQTRDGFDPIDLPMEQFEKVKSGRWWWPFGQG